jgi:hypothetical protein
MIFGAWLQALEGGLNQNFTPPKSLLGHVGKPCGETSVAAFRARSNHPARRDDHELVHRNLRRPGHHLRLSQSEEGLANPRLFFVVDTRAKNGGKINASTSGKTGRYVKTICVVPCRR